jgi:hypothetical protein
MSLVTGTIVCVLSGTVVVAIVGYLVDRYTARREASQPERGKYERGNK